MNKIRISETRSVQAFAWEQLLNSLKHVIAKECFSTTAAIQSEEVVLSHKRSGLPRSHTFTRNDRKLAFTLAETLITLTILGVVASITLPYLIQKYIEATNRTKVKKAMAAYEKVINQLVVENNITGSLQSIFAPGNCDETSKYFKAIRTVTGNKCRFQTSDRVWWDITDIEHPVIAFNEEDLDDEDAENRFIFLTNNENGVLRINDLNTVPLSEDEKAALEELYAFINNKQSGAGDSEPKTLSECIEFPCEVNGLTWNKKTLTAEEAAAASVTNSNFCILDGTECKRYDDNTSRVSANDIFLSKVTLTEDDYVDSCIGSRVTSGCTVDYWNAARKKCLQNESHLATAAELKALNTVGELDSNSLYWAAESVADPEFTNLSYFIDPIDGFISSDVRYSTTIKAVCVGN